MDEPAAASPEPSEEHRVGALLLAVASLSDHGHVRIRRGGTVWGVSVYSPRPVRGGSERHAYVAVTAETLREALTAAWERLRADHARLRL